MKKNIYFIIAISVVVLGVCVGVLKKNSEIVPSTSSVSVVDVSELATGPFTAMEILFEMDKKEKGTQLYYSEALGVGFTYKPFSDDYVPKITESGNKIRVGEYQSIEVFEKDSNVILEQAIKKQILKGLSDSECFVMFYEMGGNEVKDYTFAGISYPGEKGSNEPLFTQKHICPPQYAETNGVRYFLMNKNVPTKFLFVEIGQDSKMSDGNLPVEGSWKGWATSLRIVK